MRIRKSLAWACAAALAAAPSIGAAQTPAGAAPAGTDGLVQMKSMRVDSLYVQPGTDFRRYTRVMLDPTSVEFSPRWMRDINPARLELNKRTSPEEAAKIADEASKRLGEIFADAFTRAGYQLAAAPGPDVLRVSARVTDFYINAPDNATTSITTRSYTISRGAGKLTLEIRDSASAALLERAVDTREAPNQANFRGNIAITSTASNYGDFGGLFATWAERCVGGLAELKERSPLAVAAQSAKP